MVAHDGTCARKAAHDCKPVTEACASMVHLWQPAGTIYYDSEVTPHHAHPQSHLALWSTAAAPLASHRVGSMFNCSDLCTCVTCLMANLAVPSRL